MRISDCSSDVCSSDLHGSRHEAEGEQPDAERLLTREVLQQRRGAQSPGGKSERRADTGQERTLVGEREAVVRFGALGARVRGDRKSVVSGKSVYVGVDLGGRRIIKKNSIQTNK